MKRPGFIWLLPILSFVMGAILLFSGRQSQQHVLQQAQQSFHRQVQAAAQIVSENTAVATTSIDLAYKFAELELESAARLQGHVLRDGQKINLGEHQLQVLVWRQANNIEHGDRGGLDDKAWQVLRADLDRSEAGLLIDDGEAGHLGLMCIRLAITEGQIYACRDRQDLQRLRRQVGLAPLLRAVARSDLIYAVLQDAGGTIAASPGAPAMNAWAEDPMLQKILQAGQREPKLREISLAKMDLIEGLSVLQLPDGSSALLRVAMDAKPLQHLKSRITRQQTLLLVLIMMVLVLSFLASLFVHRAQLRNREQSARMAEQQAQARHWQSIGQMASTVAHELRNPLNTVLMVAQRLAVEFQLGEDEQQEYQDLLQVLTNEAQRLESVIRDFLDLGRPLSLNMQNVALGPALTSCLKGQKLRAQEQKKNLVIHGDVDVELRVDMARLQQIIVNLVDNALSASRSGQSVQVIWQKKNDPKLGQIVLLRVIDEGSGMTDAELERAMQAFYTSKARGIGLGLPLVKRLTEAMNGQFELKSQSGQGSQAELIWPLTSQEKMTTAKD